MPPLVKPFRALRFDPGVAGPLDDLVAPPWDVISSERLREFVDRNPHNVVRLLRPHQSELAARRLADWTEAGVLVREERPAVWRSEEEFVGPDGVPSIRHGLVARVRLEPYDKGVVLPHERIFAGPAESRLRVLRATRTKFSPVLMLHDGPPAPSVEREPDIVAHLDGTTTRLWRLDDESEIEAALATVRPPLVIADGHHRYDAARRFHEAEPSEETGYVLASLVSHEDPGLTIYPTHRLVAGAVPKLNGAFRLSAVDGGAAAGLDRLAQLDRERAAFVLVQPGEVVLAELAAGGDDPLARLDVSALERLPLENVSFTPFLQEVEEALASGRASAGFLVRAPSIAEVQAIARAGQTMPEKSTYFFPKLTSGLLFSPFDE